MAPMMMVNPAFRPTKVDRPSDVAGLVDTGQLVGLLSAEDATAVLESIYRISRERMTTRSARDCRCAVNQDDVVKDLVKCGYLKAADVADRFGHTIIDPSKDPLIVGASGIFSQAEFDNRNRRPEFRKTASIMKLVVDGFAGAGCITMGGYDYHNGNRMDGEVRDERAGKCMGACLEFAARKGVPLMMYVFSDGAISSNGMVDNSVNGPRQGPVDERQPGHGFAVLPGLQTRRSPDDLYRRRRRTGAFTSSSAPSRPVATSCARARPAPTT